jgi:hypothetical protein
MIEKIGASSYVADDSDVTVATMLRGSSRRLDPNAEHRIRDLIQVRAIAANLAEDIWAKPWMGKAGLTDRSAYVALLRIGWHHGEIIPASGVRVSVSMRKWAEKAGVRLPTINQARKRLRDEHGLIRRDGRGEGPESGAFVLLCDPARIETLLQEKANKKVSVSKSLECFISRVPLRWGGGMTGKLKEMLLDGVHRLGPATAREIAVLVHREGSEHHLKRHLGELVGMGILRLQGQKYVLHEEMAHNLMIERNFNGEVDIGKRVRADHDLQRKNFRDAWVNGEVRSQSEGSEKRPYTHHPRGERDDQG